MFKKFVGALTAAVTLIAGCITGPVTIDGLFKGAVGDVAVVGTPQSTASAGSTPPPAPATPRPPAKVVIVPAKDTGWTRGTGIGSKTVGAAAVSFVIINDQDIELVAKRFPRVGNMPTDLGRLSNVVFQINMKAIARLALVTEPVADFGVVPFSLTAGKHPCDIVGDADFAESRTRVNDTFTGFMVDETSFAFKDTTKGSISIPKKVYQWMPFCGFDPCELKEPKEP